MRKAAASSSVLTFFAEYLVVPMGVLFYRHIPLEHEQFGNRKGFGLTNAGQPLETSGATPWPFGLIVADTLTSLIPDSKTGI